jgi:hypothetical protein
MSPVSPHENEWRCFDLLLQQLINTRRRWQVKYVQALIDEKSVTGLPAHAGDQALVLSPVVEQAKRLIAGSGCLEFPEVCAMAAGIRANKYMMDTGAVSRQQKQAMNMLNRHGLLSHDLKCTEKQRLKHNKTMAEKDDWDSDLSTFLRSCLLEKYEHSIRKLLGGPPVEQTISRLQQVVEQLPSSNDDFKRLRRRLGRLTECGWKVLKTVPITEFLDTHMLVPMLQAHSQKVDMMGWGHPGLVPIECWECSDKVRSDEVVAQSSYWHQNLETWSANKSLCVKMRAILSVSETLVFLHRKGVIHGKIKPQNILLDHAGPEAAAALCDCLFQTIETYMPDAVSCYLSAPTESELEPEPELEPESELESHQSAHFQVDIFALGVTLYTITKQAPHDVPCKSGVLVDVETIQRDLQGNTCGHPELDALICRMIQPTSPISAADVEQQLGHMCRKVAQQLAETKLAREIEAVEKAKYKAELEKLEQREKDRVATEQERQQELARNLSAEKKRTAAEKQKQQQLERDLAAAKKQAGNTVTWECNLEGAQGWTQYPADVNEILERDFQSQSVSKFKLGTQSYEVDFSAGEPKQRNTATGVQRAIRRAVNMRTKTQLPSTWTTLPQGQHCALVNVKPGSGEWKMVNTEMHKTLPGAKLCKLERIQNTHLWEYYSMRKDLMTKRADGKDPNVVTVWHGTRTNDPKLIYEDAQDGFMMQFCSSGMWGKGIYFAVNAAYSNGYAHTCVAGQKSFFMAKLILGEVTEIPSNGALVKPPDKPGGGRFDTVSGTTGGSKVYIVCKF